MGKLLAGVLVLACAGCGGDDDDDDLVDAGGLIDAAATVDAVAYDAAPPSPADVAGLVLWLDAEDLGALTDEDPVALWPDRSPAGNDAANGDALPSGRWKRFEANGNATVRFDGAAQPLVAPNPIDGATNVTIFAVARRDTSVTGGGSAILDAGTTDRVLLDYGQYLGQPRFWAENGSGRGVAFSESVNDTLSVLSARKTGDRLELFVDAELEATASTTSTGAFTGTALRVGAVASQAGSAAFAGDISEILVYDRALTDEERTFVEQLLLAEYAIEASTDTSYLPGELPGMVLWLNAGFVDQLPDTETTAWLDFGGARNDATVPAGTGPTVVDDVVLGKLLRFTGTEQLQLAADPVAGPAVFSMVAVARRDPDAGAGSAIVGLREDGPSGCMLDYGGTLGTNPRFLVRDSVGLAGVAQSPDARTDLIIIQGWLSGTTVGVRVNGEPKATVDGGFSGTFDWDDYAIGAANGPSPLLFGGDIGEVLIFNRVLNTGESDALEAYLRAKHNIP